MRKIVCTVLAALLLMGLFTYAALAEDNAGDSRFTDVPGDAWYASYVADCVGKGLMSGTSETEFSPDGLMTRAMFVAVLYRYYQKNVQGTDKDLNHLGNSLDYTAGYVGTETKVDGTYPFTLEQVSIVWPDPSFGPATETEVTYRATRDQLLSGGFDSGFYAYNVKQDEDNVVSFESMSSLTLVPDSSAYPCSIFMCGGSCVASGFSGKAERVTANTDGAEIEAKTADGSEFEITLCDLGSRTAVVVRGISSGELSARLYGYDLTVEGAKGEYTVEVYEWSWRFDGDALRTYVCPAGTEKSSALPFADLRDGAYYTEALKWAAMRKLTSGVSKTKFAPNAPVTREQAAIFLYKFLRTYRVLISPEGECDFADWSDVSDYAKEYVGAAVKTGIMVGDNNGRFNPRSPIKRCEAATVFSNLYNVVSF